MTLIKFIKFHKHHFSPTKFTFVLIHILQNLFSISVPFFKNEGCLSIMRMHLELRLIANQFEIFVISKRSRNLNSAVSNK